MLKRAYGLILSVLIFTNIIEILQMELGGRKNLIIFIYLMITLLSWEYKYQEDKKDIIYELYNIDISEIWKKRANANMLGYFIKKNDKKKQKSKKWNF